MDLSGATDLGHVRICRFWLDLETWCEVEDHRGDLAGPPDHSPTGGVLRFRSDCRTFRSNSLEQETPEEEIQEVLDLLFLHSIAQVVS